MAARGRGAGQPRRPLAAARALPGLPAGARARRLPDRGAAGRPRASRDASTTSSRSSSATTPSRSWASPPSSPLTDVEASLRSSSAPSRISARRLLSSTRRWPAKPLDDPSFEPIFARAPGARQHDLAAPHAQPDPAGLPERERVPVRHLVVARLALRDRGGDGPARLLRRDGAPPEPEDPHPPRRRHAAPLRRPPEHDPGRRPDEAFERLKRHPIEYFKRILRRYGVFRRTARAALLRSSSSAPTTCSSAPTCRSADPT